MSDLRAPKSQHIANLSAARNQTKKTNEEN